MWDKRSDMIVHDHEPYNAEPPPHALADQPVTPTHTFYSRNHGAVPNVDVPAWRLHVDGLVTNTLDLSLADLQREFEPTTLAATLQCAGNRRTGLLKVRDIPGEAPWGPAATSTATWTGVRLGDVLVVAGVSPQAQHVAFEAPDVALDADPVQVYGSSIPVAKALSEEVLLVWEMNGEALPPVHGGPVRVVVPGYIGARSVKWVERITAQREPSQNYYQAVAYRLPPAPLGRAGGDPATAVALGPVALSSAILRPADATTVAAGPVEISGYAYAGERRGIAQVDVSVDGGSTWAQATLDSPVGDWAWCLWRLVVPLPEGPSRITVRAWDATGLGQPESAADVWNPKGYVNNSWDEIQVVVQR